MYKHVIDEMVQAGIAKNLEVPIWMDRYGNKCSKDKALDCKVTHQITRPDMCVMGDEVGGNLSMKGDGHIGGSLYDTEKGKVPQKKVSKRDRRCTLMGLTALTGEPVMALMIIQGKQPKGNLEFGIDITVDPVGNYDDPAFILHNSGPGKYFLGGPRYQF